MARQRAAATAGLLAAGSIALPFVFATPAMAAPGQTFSGTASSNFLAVGAAPTAGITELLAALTVADPTGTLTGTVADLVDSVGLAAGVELGNATAAANAPEVDPQTASATASNLAAALELDQASTRLTALDAGQVAPPDNAAPDTASATVDLGPVLTAGLVTNTAGARALGADNCPVADAPLGLGSSVLTDVSLLDFAGTGLVTTDEVTSTSSVALVAAGQPGLSTQSTATLDVAGLTLFGGTDAETVIDLTGGQLTALVPDATGAAVLDYTAPTGTITTPGGGGAVALPEGSSDTVYLPLTPAGETGPSLALTYVFNTITDADVQAGVVDASILGLTLAVDLDGTGAVTAPVDLVDLGIGALGVDATNIAGGITCGTPPVTPPVTPPGTTTPVVNPIAGGPARPAALANTGAEPLPMLGLGLGLLAVGGAALGAGPLRRRMSNTPSA
ncbi:hypothetical protein F1C76_13630 [Geodermatophilaceae bacterium NBWT11]|nr:hypothetical protein F1C76_13630 [Geodermatophilaceae bacterium NBWT11]